MRYKLLRNGKRQILNVVLPGDIVGLPGSFYERAVYSVSAITDLRMHVCALDAYVQLCYQRPQFGLALSLDRRAGGDHLCRAHHRRRPPHADRAPVAFSARAARAAAGGRLAEENRFTLPFSQEVMADVLGLSVPHLNRMMQQLRAEKLIADSERQIEFIDIEAMQTLAHYQPLELTPIPRLTKPT